MPLHIDIYLVSSYPEDVIDEKLADHKLTRENISGYIEDYLTEEKAMPIINKYIKP